MGHQPWLEGSHLLTRTQAGHYQETGALHAKMLTQTSFDHQLAEDLHSDYKMEALQLRSTNLPHYDNACDLVQVWVVATCNSCLAVGTALAVLKSEKQASWSAIKEVSTIVDSQGFLLTVPLSQYSEGAPSPMLADFQESLRHPVMSGVVLLLFWSSPPAALWLWRGRNLINTSSAPLPPLLTGWSQRTHDISCNFPSNRRHCLECLGHWEQLTS